MPILEVKVVGAPPPSVRKKLAQSLADAVGHVLESGPQHTWVTLRIVSRKDYAENDGTPRDISPVFVRILKREAPDPKRLQSEVKALTLAIAGACRRPEKNVHIIYEPPGRGRVAFGGRLLR